MSDMHYANALNAEVHRRMDAVWETYGIKAYAERFAFQRERLIKEGWQPEVDEAEELYQSLISKPHTGLSLVRAALAKARAHPAEVVEAIHDLNKCYNSTALGVLSAYILHNV